VVLSLALLGCADRSSDEACRQTALDGTCIGVTRPWICTDRFCTTDAACRRVWYVDGETASPGDGSAALPLGTPAAAAALAIAGDCIALAPGTYPGCALPGGVSLLGAGADAVQITTPLTASGGQGALLRGFALDVNGVALSLSSAPQTRLEQVRVQRARRVGLDVRRSPGLVLKNLEIRGVAAEQVPPVSGGPPASFGIGLLLVAGSSTRVDTTLIEGCATLGVLASDSPLELARSDVSRSGHHGVALDSRTGTAARLELTRIEESRGVGLLVIGGELVLRDSAVGRTAYSDGFAANVQAQDARVEIRGSRIHDAAGQGLVLHGCGGTLRESRIEQNDERGVHIEGSARGLELSDNAIVDNQRAGLICIAADPVRVRGGEISRTASRMVLDGVRAASVGDGVQVLAGSGVTLQQLTLRDNPRYGVLVDAGRASLTDVGIGGSEAPVVAQSTGPGDVTLQRVTDLDGDPVSLSVPVAAALVGAAAGARAPLPQAP